MPYITARHDKPSSGATLKQSKNGENGYNTDIGIIDVYCHVFCHFMLNIRQSCLKKVLISWPLINMLNCENIFNWPLWEELYQGLMDGFLDVSKAL